MRRFLIILLLASSAGADSTKPCASNPAYVFPQEHWMRVDPAQGGWSVAQEPALPGALQDWPASRAQQEQPPRVSPELPAPLREARQALTIAG